MIVIAAGPGSVVLQRQLVASLHRRDRWPLRYIADQRGNGDRYQRARDGRLHDAGQQNGRAFGTRRLFQATVVFHGLAMLTMALSHSAAVMIVAQGMAGVAAAAMAPALVVMIAANYEGRQQAQALGLLGGAAAMAGVLAFVVAGSRYGHRLALRVRIRRPARGLRFRPEPSAEAGPASVQCSDRLGRRASGGIRDHADRYRRQHISSWPPMSKPTAPFSFFGRRRRRSRSSPVWCSVWNFFPGSKAAPAQAKDAAHRA